MDFFKKNSLLLLILSDSNSSYSCKSENSTCSSGSSYEDRFCKIESGNLSKSFNFSSCKMKAKEKLWQNSSIWIHLTYKIFLKKYI